MPELSNEDQKMEAVDAECDENDSTKFEKSPLKSTPRAANGFKDDSELPEKAMKKLNKEKDSVANNTPSKSSNNKNEISDDKEHEKSPIKLSAENNLASKASPVKKPRKTVDRSSDEDEPIQDTKADVENIKTKTKVKSSKKSNISSDEEHSSSHDEEMESAVGAKKKHVARSKADKPAKTDKLPLKKGAKGKAASGSESEDDNQEEELKSGLYERSNVLKEGEKRERKKTDRLSIGSPPASDKKDKKLEIAKGSGVALGDIQRIEFFLEKTRGNDLKVLHRVLFSRIVSPAFVKKNIRQFSGFSFASSSSEYDKKKEGLNKQYLPVLKQICVVLDLERHGTKGEIVERIMEFLMKPSDSGKAIPKSKKHRSRRSSSEKGGKKKRSRKASKDKSDKPKSKKRKVADDDDNEKSASNDDEDDASDYDEKDSDEDSPAKKTHSSKKRKLSESEDDAEDKSVNEKEENDEEEEEKLKAKRVRKSPVKKRKSKSANSDDDEDNEEDKKPQAKRVRKTPVKKGKSENSDEEEDDEEDKKAKAKRVRKTPVKKGKSEKSDNEEEDEEEEEEHDKSSDEADDDFKPGKNGPKVKKPTKKQQKDKPKKAATKKMPEKKEKHKVEAKKPKQAANRDSGISVSSDKEEQAVDKNDDDSSEDDLPLAVKKTDKTAPPTDTELRTFIKKLLDSSNLEEVTMKAVITKVCAAYPSFNMESRKDFIKTTVKEMIK